MKPNMNGNSSMQCRICLAHGAEICLFDSDEILFKLSQSINEQIEDKVGYPRHICTSCNNTLEIVYTFVKMYKESNKLLEETLKTSVKMEFEDVADNYFDFVEVQQEPVVAKKEPKIVFDNAQQFLELLKPFKSKIKKESKKKIKMVPKTKIKKENRQNKINVRKRTQKVENLQKSIKNESILEQNKDGSISDSIDTIEIETVKVEFDNHTSETEEKIESKASETTALCDLCGDVFEKIHQLQKHRIQVHFKTSLQCPVCEKKFTTTDGLNRHYRRHHGMENKDYVCSSCGKAFVFESDMNKHYKSVHERHLLKKKRYPCTHCDKTYTTAKMVLMHVRSAHTGERPAVCSVCDSRFTHDDYLKEHMRLHTGETPFKCPICHRGYAQRGNMKSHIRHRHSRSELDELTLKILKPNILRMLKP